MSSMYVFTPKRGKSNLSCFTDCEKHASAGALKLTKIFHVAVRLFSNRSQMTSKCGKNKKVAHET